MKRFVGFMLGLIVAASAAVFAVSGGGVPSFLRLQALGVNTTVPAAGSVALSGNLTAGANITATTGNIVATAGNITSSAGTVAGTNVTAGGVNVCRSDSTNCPISTGSYTATVTGCTTSPTLSISYVVVGTPAAGIVTINGFTLTTCTSNANTFTLTGAPAAIRPTSTNSATCSIPESLQDNGAVVTANTTGASMSTGGTLTFLLNASSTGWTASGTKGINFPFSCTYIMR